MIKQKKIFITALFLFINQSCKTNDFTSSKMKDENSNTEMELNNLSKKEGIINPQGINITLNTADQNSQKKERCCKFICSAGCCCGLITGLTLGGIAIGVYFFGAYHWTVFPQMHNF